MNNHSTNENAVTYRALAHFYDTMMGGNKYPGWKNLIASVVKQYHVATGTCLDVACGTGNISKLALELGFRVVGVDMSKEMVSVAQTKFPNETFIASDIRDFTLGQEATSGITLAVSFYDSLNYLLSDEDMLKALEAVYRNVASGTIFLFDMNTLDHVQAAQKYAPRVQVEPDFYSVYRFSGEGRFWVLDMDIFVKEGAMYRLAQERHVERSYDRDDIVPLVKKAGFELLEVKEEYKVYPDGVNRLSRLYFIVRKP
ncbi:MAG: class I SAM-dependent methyltransferase [Patescibacteria group bacterium]|jgi:ubiquinone/menaquinone biosynthesis C-methylase UbiE